MATPDYTTFTLARAAIGALCALTVAHVGVKLLTLMTRDPFEGYAERIHSNMPHAYYVSGRKPVNRPRWSEEVIERRRIFAANDIAGITEVFPDHELIRLRGCESVINVYGEVVGMVNCLQGAGFYTLGKVAAAEASKLPAAVCFLLHERSMKKESL